MRPHQRVSPARLCHGDCVRRTAPNRSRSAVRGVALSTPRASVGSDDGPTPTIGAMSETYYDSDRSDEFGFGGPRSTAGIQGICIHTTESGKSATATSSTADAVTSYQVRTRIT